MIAVGSDHAGFRLKGIILDFLRQRGVPCRDLGTTGTDAADYPDFARAVAEAVRRGECSRGIVICGTGIGTSIAANKVPGIRAALCADPYSARMSREHNDANVLCLGERVVGPGLALAIVETWLEAEFTGGRHRRRVDKIAAIERDYASEHATLEGAGDRRSG